ncbi:sigma-54-dependent Fis family transcriptional regulator [Marinobacterium arenosum]|uniref:sigma-54-dependent Fis family transcriptional regulator n=1 Tax=Marinobacterium arenosum TaxID=2862496 RepID=UPI001C93C2DB|nr:sigma-54-dependent Fis family transcriptional regulator [Marinobacterium arenosum]MBY4675028.1 sigma-54-dependent Fis family transcriptional regulator [Marinobacterium arenosum]
MAVRNPSHNRPPASGRTERIVTPEIEGSWRRCIEQYHLEPGRDLRAPRLGEAEIRNAREQLDNLLYSADPVFERLRQLGGNSGYCVLVTDANGIVLRQYIDTQRGQELADKGLTVGTVWNEELVGTNGLGTCLASGEALTVYADEHFGRELQRFSCSTAPLIAPDGEMIGALDISTYAQGDKIGQGLALNLVCDTADQIEAAMFRHAYARHHLLALVGSPMADAGQANALLAVNDSGWILGATSPALLQLGVSERNLIVGQGLAALTGATVEELHRGPVALTDAGSPGCWLVRLSGQLTTTDKPTTTNAPSPAPRRLDSPLYRAAGRDPQLLRNADICHRVLERDISILLQGETGTGKEVWAQALHDSSSRREKPFVTLNCAAIPESLIESELFGYSAGTFTGGLKGGKAGKIEASNGGTLFLDEIGDMPLALQARLLRVLAEREITPLGQVQPVKVDLHVICATHRDLTERVERGEFREDLYYRISGVRVALPALRERQDRNELIDKLLLQLSELNDQLNEKEHPVSIDPQALQVLNQYHWPGNIRQLKNALQFALCMCDSQRIRITDLPDEVFPPAPGEMTAPTEPVSNEAPPQRLVSLAQPHGSGPLAPDERARILAALQQHRWVVLRAAEALGISRSTLHRKIKKYGLHEC